MVSTRSGRKQPSQKVDGGDGHANAEEHAGKNAFRTTFAEGKGESRHDDGNEGESASDGTGEGLLQNTDGVLPGRVAGRLRERRSCKDEAQQGSKNHTA